MPTHDATAQSSAPRSSENTSSEERLAHAGPNAKARTVWRSWVFRGYVAMTVLLAIWIAAADPFALSGSLAPGAVAWVIPPLLFLGLMAALAWLATLVFSRRTPGDDAAVARRRQDERRDTSG
jgi:hypothetical protein